MSKEYVMQLEATVANLQRDKNLLKEIKNKQEKEIARYKEVLRLVNEKYVDLVLVKMASSVEQYNHVYVYEHNLNKKMCLTKEEFNLIKEMCRDV